MMEQAGKCILVNGPTMTGKTAFITRLLSKYGNAKIVNFERFYSKANFVKYAYKDFYNCINELLDKNFLVIGESIRSYIGIDIEICPISDCLSIIINPGIKQHAQNIKFYSSLFGEEKTKKRTCGLYPSSMWERFSQWSPPNALIYNGNNWAEILKRIEEYVGY